MIRGIEIAYKQDSETGAAGPEDPMLEQRVAVLESDVGKIKGILERLEPKITELLLTGAKQADLQRLQADVARLDGRLTGVEGRFAGVEGKIAGVEAKIGGVEAKIGGVEAKIGGVDGKIAGLESRIASLPTTWTLLGIVFTTWALGSGIVFTIAKLAK